MDAFYYSHPAGTSAPSFRSVEPHVGIHADVDLKNNCHQSFILHVFIMSSIEDLQRQLEVEWDHILRI